jgi:glucosyl-3-phosphoglycerate synthase
MAGYSGIVESGTGKRNPFYMDMTVWEWFGRRSFRHPDYRGLVAGGRTTTLILPARNVAATIGPILDSVAGLRARTGLVDQVWWSTRTPPTGPRISPGPTGPRSTRRTNCCPSSGLAQGKGDAMWRGLSAARGDIVMYADTDTT